MAALPNVNVPLVGNDRRPTRALLGLFPDLNSDDVAVDRAGSPSTAFRAQLEAVGYVPATPLVNPDGTPTRVLTAILMRLP